MSHYYTLEMLTDLYRRTETNLPESEAQMRAKNLHRQLNTMDISWIRSNRRFYSHNLLNDFSDDHFAED